MDIFDGQGTPSEATVRVSPEPVGVRLLRLLDLAKREGLDMSLIATDDGVVFLPFQDPVGYRKYLLSMGCRYDSLAAAWVLPTDVL